MVVKQAGGVAEGARFAHAGRAGWKHENEGHKVLTTLGYQIKHNFGHGKQHLATVMFTVKTQLDAEIQRQLLYFAG